jgi:hypothetical protein
VATYHFDLERLALRPDPLQGTLQLLGRVGTFQTNSSFAASQTRGGTSSFKRDHTILQ